MSQLDQTQVERVKQVVRARLEQMAQGLHSQSKMNLTETEYGDGYASAQNSCSEQIYELVEELMAEIDGAVKPVDEDVVE